MMDYCYIFSESQSRFKQISELFSSPITGIYLLFTNQCYQCLYSLTCCSRPLQCIDILQKLLSTFVKVAVIKVVSTVQLKSVEYKVRENQLSDRAVFIGFVAIQKLLRLEIGNISPLQVKKFMEDV